MRIQLLGVSTPLFKQLKLVLTRLSPQLGINAEVEEVNDIDTIIKMGATAIPAVAVDGQILLSYPSPEGYDERQLITFLQSWQKMDDNYDTSC